MNRYSEAIQFERRVAAIFRSLGAEVEHNTAIAGNQVDVLLKEETTSGTPVRTVVECKNYRKFVGISVVRAFAGLVVLLKDRNLIDKAILVSSSGFTQAARAAAKEFDINLYEIADLEEMVENKDKEVNDIEKELAAIDEEKSKSSQPLKAFVVMPFKSEYEDVYILGIREVAEEIGIIVERADEIEHNESIPDLIRNKIQESDIIVAETSEINPNVFYEVGLAHGLNKETILVCQKSENIPFDLNSINHVIYNSIVDLRDKLANRLKKSLNL